MYSAPLSKPRAKNVSRRRRRLLRGGGGGGGGEGGGEEEVEGPPDPLVLQQPFPVPIASLTHIPANNSIWRWYKGKLAGDHVVLMAAGDDEGGDGDARKLWQMGYFGEMTGEDAEGERKYSQVTLEEINPGREDAEKIVSDSTITKRSDGIDNNIVTMRLEFCEAFFLSYALGCLLVHKEVEVKDKQGSSSKGPPPPLLSPLSIDEMWSEFCSAEASFPTRYAVYHHFRCKGWVVRSGQRQFGCHFLLYKHGPPFFHASYSVRVEAEVEEESSSSWRDLAGLNRVTEAAAKELLLPRVKRIDGASATASSSSSSPSDVLARLLVEEVLVRRWVPSQEREDV